MAECIVNLVEARSNNQVFIDLAQNNDAMLFFEDFTQAVMPIDYNAPLTFACGRSKCSRPSMGSSTYKILKLASTWRKRKRSSFVARSQPTATDLR